MIDRGASVLSCSSSAAARYFSLSLRNALSRVATLGRGCVLVFAAGNENRPVNGTVNETGWPNNQPSGPTPWLIGFAAHEDVVAVAASSSTAAKSAYSNWGTEISVCTPQQQRAPAHLSNGDGAGDRKGDCHQRSRRPERLLEHRLHAGLRRHLERMPDGGGGSPRWFSAISA